MCVYYTMYVYADVQKVLHSARVQGLAPDLTVTIRWEAEIQITLQGNVLYQLHELRRCCMRWVICSDLTHTGRVPPTLSHRWTQLGRQPLPLCYDYSTLEQ